VAIVLQEVDPDDLSTVLFDYSDQTGANNPGTVKAYFGVGGTFDLGAPDVSIDNTDRQGDGRRDVVFSYDDLVASSFSVRFQASSYDNLRTAVGVLQRLLGAEGVMRYVPTGSTTTYYIYRKPSSIPALFSGAELELYKAGALTEGTILVEFNRERLMRGATLLASVNKLKNSTLLGFSPSSGGSSSTTPFSWDWDSTANITFGSYGANVNWSQQSYRFAIATTGTRNLQQSTGVASAAPGDVWTFSFYVKASGGALAKAQAVLEFMSSAPAVLATASGTLTTLTNGADFTRLTITSSAAPASTDRVRVNLRMANGDGTSYTVDFRRAQLEKAASASQYRVGVETVSNGGGAWSKSMLAYNPGDANALARLSVVPGTSSQTIAYNLARKSEGQDVNLAEAVTPTAASTWRTQAIIVNQTLYSGTAGDTSGVPDGSHFTVSPSNLAKTTFTNQESLVRRWRWVNTPTDPEALHGRWDVYVAVRPEVGSDTDTRYRICLHWQAANRNPVTNVENEISIDATNPTTGQYVPLLLGTVNFDADAGDATLVLEGWAGRDAGSGSLWWDFVYLLPADEQQTLLEVPGFREGDQGKEVWLGSELTSADSGTNKPAGIVFGATVSGTKVVLDTVNEGAGSPPSTTNTGGIVWSAGWHTATASVDLRVPAGTAATGIGRLRIRKAPGPGASVPAFATTTAYVVGDFVKPISGGAGGGLLTRTYRCTTAGTSGGAEAAWGTTDGGTTAQGTATFTETTVASRQLITKKNFTSTRKTFSCGVTADGTTAYEIVVVAGSGITGVSGKIHVLRVTHTNLRVVDDGYSAQMLGDLEVLQTATAAGVGVDDLVKEGPFITLGPGTNVVWFDQWALPPFGYDDMTDDPLAKHDPSNSMTVTVDLLPRYWS
jgi:hypothetical protein